MRNCSGIVGKFHVIRCGLDNSVCQRVGISSRSWVENYIIWERYGYETVCDFIKHE